MRNIRTLITRILRLKCYDLLILAAAASIVVIVIDVSGVTRHLQEKSFDEDFTYPLEDPKFIDIVQEFRNGKDVEVQPINTLYKSITIESNFIDKCIDELSILIMVKSAPSNGNNRNAIRETWKASTEKFKGKLLFFVGNAKVVDGESRIAQDLREESHNHRDIVRLGFDDSYYNNTIKTMLEIRWATEECSNFSHALLVDDDYFVSVKNLFKFIENPLNYPKTDEIHNLKVVDKLYAGYRMFPPPHRHKIFTKWYMPLDEYPFDYFPPYITAGAILLSRNTLFDLYYASFYTQHFRFDDVYVAICAKKMNISPTHTEFFRFWTTRDETPEEHLIASHGFSDPERLRRFWNTQKNRGYC